MSVELDIINAMIAVTGIAAVTSVDARHPAIRKAQPRLARVNKEIQTRGWWFNREYALKLYPNASDEIITPSNALALDPTDGKSDIIRRGPRLYDPVNHTYTFTEGVNLPSGYIEVDVVGLLDYDLLPYPAIQFITALATQRHAAIEEGDATLLRELANDTFLARAEMMSKEISQLDLNALNSPQAKRTRIFRIGAGGGLFNVE